ncbi:hypothetical protein [uncultured Clostridium sp.]|uniref:hypothetical protein n=1 Tax=uncultured Clostridium sp. TaxID=59620 RepID=UPI0028F01ACC|nr:hypothetical protein [uncultured Clostridium sp.]
MYIIRAFGMLSREEQVKILKAFESQDEEMFFPYFVPGLGEQTPEEIECLVEEVSEDFSKDYFEKTYYVYDEVKLVINKKIEKLISDYLENNIVTKVDSIEKLKDSVRQGDLQNVDKKVAHDIKHTIGYELLLNNYDKKEYEEMKKRKVFENTVMFDEQGRHYEDDEIIWWYSLKNTEDLWNEIMRVCGKSIIVADKNKPFDLHSYALVYVETANDYDLLIYTKKNTEFEKIVVPKIVEINRDIVKYIEKY